MADNKKYYYLKLKDNYFDNEALIVLESMPDGYLYSNILLKLYLRSLKADGRLMFNEKIPYNTTILAQITRHSVGVVEKALQIFQEIDLIEVLDNGAIYLLDIQDFIGESNTEADRKRKYRARIKQEAEAETLSGGQTSDVRPPELEIEIEIEKEIEIEIEKEIKKDAPTKVYKFNDNSFEMLCVETIIHSCLKLYPNSKVPVTNSEKNKWAIEIDRMRRLDKRNDVDIKQALTFALKDDFWQVNIRSTKKFREKFETLFLQSKQKRNNKVSTSDYAKELEDWANG